MQGNMEIAPQGYQQQCGLPARIWLRVKRKGERKSHERELAYATK